MAKLLGIDIVGGYYHDKTEEDVICRLTQKPLNTANYHYLVVADQVEQISSSYCSLPNIIVVKDFKKIKYFIKKKRQKNKIGLEVLISDIRYADGLKIGRWFKEMTDLYKLSKTSNYQFIISSGATSIWEMISARCFESILNLCSINIQHYWKELEDWIEINNRIRIF